MILQVKTEEISFTILRIYALVKSKFAADGFQSRLGLLGLMACQDVYWVAGIRV